MDLESESSALESVGDNGLIPQTSVNTADEDNNVRSLDHGSFSDDSVKLVSTRSVDNETSGKALNFGSSSPVLSKGRGLRKWRRIRRDLVKDTSGNMENSKVLKRGLSGSASAHSHGNNKQMLFQSPEFEQESQGSVGSVNMLKSIGGGDGFDDASRFMAGIGFSAGVVGLGKDDDRSSKSSTPMVISSGQRGKGRVENSKKHRGESVEKENSHSSLESDSRKPSGSMMMNFNGRIGDEADLNGETSKRNDTGEEEEEEEGEESINNNNGFSEELDPLTEAIDGFFTLQEALEKELQQYGEIGKETMQQHYEGASEVSSPRSEIVTLVNTVEQLEIKLEETRSMLEVKESHIRELESTTNQNKRSLGESGNVSETVVEDIFRQRIEAEIEYLIYSRSIDNLNHQMKLIETQEALAEEQAYETLNKLDKVQTKAASLRNRAEDLQNECIETTGNMKKRACKMTSCFLIQLVLLLTVVLVFMSQLVPESSDIVVVPT